MLAGSSSVAVFGLFLVLGGAAPAPSEALWRRHSAAVPTATCTVKGDPHIITFDCPITGFNLPNASFPLNVRGEFLLLEGTNEDEHWMVRHQLFRLPERGQSKLRSPKRVCM